MASALGVQANKTPFFSTNVSPKNAPVRSIYTIGPA